MPVEITCETCGKVFSVPPIRVRRGVRFCSRACAHGWSKDDVDWLRGFYEAAEGRPVDLRIAEIRLGRLRSNISRKACGLGLTDQGRPKATGQKALPLNETLLPPEKLKERRSNRAKDRIKKHGHPRGALGMKHTDEAKARISELHQRLWADPTSAHNTPEASQRRADQMYERIRAGKHLSSNAYSRCRGGKREDLGGLFVRSSWEANYARYLNLLVAQGQLASWEYESKTFEFEGIKRGTRFYTPDFRVVFPDGHYEWHEVKGWMDPKSKTRLRRMAKYHPDESVIVFDAEWFRSAKRSGIADTVAGWERG